MHPVRFCGKAPGLRNRCTQQEILPALLSGAGFFYVLNPIRPENLPKFQYLPDFSNPFCFNDTINLLNMVQQTLQMVTAVDLQDNIDSCQSAA